MQTYVIHLSALVNKGRTQSNFLFLFNFMDFHTDRFSIDLQIMKSFFCYLELQSRSKMGWLHLLYFPKHDLLPILSCRNHNSANQNPSGPRNRAQLAFLMVVTRKRNHNFALIPILLSIKLVKNGFFGSKFALNC